MPRAQEWTPFELVFTRSDGDREYENALYHVLVRDLPDGWVSLGIRRKDGGSIRDWNALQRCKNDLTDSEREGVELFPAESRLVDCLHESHIFVAPAGNRFRHGFESRFVLSEK
jgi:hypothetical protein